jgi:hypothetical protein
MILVVNPFRFAASGGSGARYWRVRMADTQRVDGFVTAAEIQLHSVVGGANIAAGKTYTEDAIYSAGFEGSKAFDGNAATYYASPVAVAAGGHWITVDFGAGNSVTVEEFTYQAEPSTGSAGPKNLILEYSSNGSSWTTAIDTGTLAAWAPAETRTFNKLPVNTVLPVITGDNSTYGNVLTCSDGTYTNSPTSFTKTWKRGATVLGTGDTYTTVLADDKHQITCEVVPHNTYGDGVAAIANTLIGSRIRSSSIVGGGGSSLVVAWPAGTVSGDRVVIFASSAWSVTTPSGWTQHDNQAGSGINGAMFSKVLGSTDITAGSVTVNFAGAYGCVAVAVTCRGAPTVAFSTATRAIASGGTITLTGGLSGDEPLFFAGVRDGTAGTGTINFGNTLQAADYSGNQAHGRVTCDFLAASGSQAATITHNGSAYFGGVLLR